MRISIIIATLNSENTINLALDSIIRQKYGNIEVIIIDGNSNDSTITIVNSYRKKIRDMKIISEKDNGIYEAFNKGISIATGDLIGILGSDDMYKKNAFITLKNYYDTDTDIYYGNIIRFQNINDKDSYYIRKSENLRYFNKKMPIRHLSCFVKNEWYKKLQYDESYKICGDYHFLYKSYLSNAVFKYIDYEFVYMREGGISSYNKDKIFEDFRIKKEFNSFYIAFISYLRTIVLFYLAAFKREIMKRLLK